jgi:class 3 adenylate cyclase
MARDKTIDNVTDLAESLVTDSAEIYLFFADMVGSTEYKNTLKKQNHPDIIWILRQFIFLKRSAKILQKYNGFLVKTIGDEIFGFFDKKTNPQNIINCGIEIIQAFENLKAFSGNSKIDVKISIDFGITYNGSIGNSPDVFDPIGLPVDRCARLNHSADKNEIAFSEDFLRILITKTTLKKIKQKYVFQMFQNEEKGLGKITYYKICAK